MTDVEPAKEKEIVRESEVDKNCTTGTTTSPKPTEQTTTTTSTTEVPNNVQPCVRPKDTFYWGDLPRNDRSESPKPSVSQQSTPKMAGIHPVQKTTLDHTELILVNQDKHKYMDTSYKKVSAKMYDHNCDVKLKVDKEVFRGHKSVLSDASDYFAAMFSHDMIEKGQDAIVLHDISPRGFTAMLEYFYHGHIIVERDSIEDVLEAARFFHIEWLLQVCCDFLVRHLSLENYHNVLHLADKYFMDDLRYDIFRFVGQNFVMLSDHEKFMDLSFELFYQLLAEDYFIDATEDLIFRTIQRWVQHDAEKREEQLSSLLQLVRYPLMEPEELNTIPDEVLMIKEVKELVDDAVEYHNNPHIQPLMTTDCTEMRGAQDAVMMITALEDANLVQYKIPDLVGFIGEQVDWSFMDSVFEFSALAVLGNFVFVAGGYDRNTYCSSTVCYRYNPRNRTWVELAPMHQPRVSHTMCAGKKGIFVVAGIDHIVEEGHDREIILNSVEYYCIQSGCWQIMPCLPVACFSVAAAVNGGELFVSGGITDDVEDSIPTNYLRGYIYGKDSWVSYQPMLVERQGHAMVAHDEKLYVFGGHTTAQDGMTFEHCLVNEVYDIETNQWSQLRDTPADYGHIYSSAALLGNRIYLVGGKHTNRYLTSYNTSEEELEEGTFCGQLVQRVATIRIAFPHDLIQPRPRESSGTEG